MDTLYWTVNKTQPELPVIRAAAKIIKEGGLVAFPTETVYGLGANGLDRAAVKKIFAAKGRPGDNPLILHIAHNRDLFYLADPVPLKAQVLMEAFWPGPLTLVLPRRSLVPYEVTAGLDTVAVRMPRNPVALALIREAGVPVAAPSANRSGYPSPTEASHVRDDLNGRIEAILDGGPAGLGLESTVLDLSGETPVILRPGGVTKEELEQVIGDVDSDPWLKEGEGQPKAPGMKYTHYAPRAKVVLVDGSPEKVPLRIRDLTADFQRQGLEVGLLLTDETWAAAGSLAARYTKILGSRRDLSGIGQKLYGELRHCDRMEVDVIITETYREEGLGAALMNRLLKSAGYNVVEA